MCRAGTGSLLLPPEESPIGEKGAFFMKNVHRKWWLAVVVVLCLVPAASAKNKHKKQLPEGGSAVVYLIETGITCLGAMVVRSRFTRPKQL
jgi:hypothetical protein